MKRQGRHVRSYFIEQHVQRPWGGKRMQHVWRTKEDKSGLQAAGVLGWVPWEADCRTELCGQEVYWWMCSESTRCGGVKTVGMDKGRSGLNSEAVATETLASPLDCSAAEILFRALRLAEQTFILLHGQIDLTQHLWQVQSQPCPTRLYVIFLL